MAINYRPRPMPVNGTVARNDSPSALVNKKIPHVGTTVKTYRSSGTTTDRSREYAGVQAKPRWSKIRAKEDAPEKEAPVYMVESETALLSPIEKGEPENNLVRVFWGSLGKVSPDYVTMVEIGGIDLSEASQEDRVEGTFTTGPLTHQDRDLLALASQPISHEFYAELEDDD